MKKLVENHFYFFFQYAKTSKGGPENGVWHIKTTTRTAKKSVLCFSKLKLT